MRWNCRLVLFALLVLFPACNGGDLAVNPSPDQKAPDGVVADGAGEIVIADVPLPDVIPDMVADTPVDPDVWEVVPACEVGDGCFGDPCDDNKDCLSGWCVDHLGGTVCTGTCQEECPAGWSCKQAGTDPDVVWVCVSDLPSLCVPCATNTDCVSLTGVQAPCVDYGAEGAFCGGACEDAADCPEGYACQEVETTAGASLVQCVSQSGTCDCTDKSAALGLSTPCVAENEFGTCEGQRICTTEGLSACDAAEPTTEFCDGLDDDCDGQVDEETCDDGNPCTDDVCLGEAGCEHVALEGGECADGNPCTAADHCIAGVCVGDPVICDDQNPCTDDSCTEIGGCDHVSNVVDCDDGDPCTVADECGDGSCAGTLVACDCEEDADCLPLEDGDLCNGTLVCDTVALPYQCVVDPGTIVDCPAPEGPDAPCLAPSCNPETGECGFAEDNEGFPCDDEDPCSVADSCEKGDCITGVAANCNDGNLCTDDSCEPGVGCAYASNTIPCEDGDVCTVGDQCEDGECVHGPDVSCDDGNVCTDDSCDPAVGCVHAANMVDCDDGNACTEFDTCGQGGCQPGGAVNCDDENLCTTDSCNPVGGCVYATNTVPCNDGDACTLGDVCGEGDCQGGALLPCDDGNVCTDDSCDPASGCVFLDNTAPCDDNNTCTTSDTCVGGECIGEGSLDCDDDNPCTKDVCLPGGGCDHEDIAGPCSDGDPCTLNDVCDQGACVPGAAQDCDDGNPCTDDLCDADGACKNSPNQATCSDGNACTEGDHCDGGACVAAGLEDCDDADVCTTDSCDPATGCVYTLNEDPCDDEDLCTTGDHCHLGTCIGGGILSCDDGNICTDDSCIPLSGCAFVPNDAGCDDGNVCSLGDHCDDGWCVPTSFEDCDDGNVCTDDTCSSLGGCANVNNAAACDDGDACTVVDLCTAGACVGVGALGCDDGNVCTDDSCDPGLGCVNVNNSASCDDGNACTPVNVCIDGVCVGSGVANCDDQNGCTDDSCDPDIGCVSVNNSASCNDANACTVTDVCQGGTCVGSGAPNCNDGDPCTTDSCAPATGCTNTTMFPCCGNDVVEAPEECDDGNQTPGDGCDGSCHSEGGGCVKLGLDVRTLEQGPEDWQLGYCNSAYCENTPTAIAAGFHIATIAEVAHLTQFVKFGSCAAYGICGSYWYGGGLLTSNCSMLSYSCTTGGCIASTSHCYTQVMLIRDGKDGTCHY